MLKKNKAKAKVNTVRAWQKNINRAILGIGLLTSFLLFSVIASFWGISSRPEPKYYAAREDGTVVPIIAVRGPFLTDNQVVNFTKEALTRVMTINFRTYQNDVNEMSPYFQRPEGWSAFAQSMESSGTIEYMRSNNFISSAVANNGYVVNRMVAPSGRYVWLVQVNLVITYESASQRQIQKVVAEAEVLQMPTGEANRGMAIRRLVMSKG